MGFGVGWGVTELSAWDFSDIWQVWLSRGTLNPGGHRDQQVVAVTLPDNETWERAAAWEPLEMVLTGAGLPASWEWTFAKLDEPGQATGGFLHNIFLLLADPNSCFTCRWSMSSPTWESIPHSR